MLVLRLEMPSVLPTAHSVPICHRHDNLLEGETGWIEPRHPIVLAGATFNQSTAN